MKKLLSLALLVAVPLALSANSMRCSFQPKKGAPSKPSLDVVMQTAELDRDATAFILSDEGNPKHIFASDPKMVHVRRDLLSVKNLCEACLDVVKNQVDKAWQSSFAHLTNIFLTVAEGRSAVELKCDVPIDPSLLK